MVAVVLLSVVLFMAAFWASRIVPLARRAIGVVLEAFATLRNPAIGDDAREAMMRRGSLTLLGAFVQIALRSALALAAAALPIFVADWAGLVPRGAVFDFLARVDVIVAITVTTALAWYLFARAARPLNDYSTLDRMLHRLAFSHAAVQFAAADCEAATLGSAFRGIAAERPIFVTSLPRAGTTIILSALNRLPQLGTHLYRDMPFVMAPLLWSRLSRRMQKASAARERAHGDGIRISADSPEAFEEVIWRAFWPKKYGADGIALWTEEDADPRADAFLRDHFRKIVALRCGERAGDGRYLSKNNANVARIDYLAAAMPDAAILVPLRRPLDHAASLLLQHRNFLALHARDRFAARYMADIGHFEFGELHRPILFPGFADARRDLSPDSIDYWLAYWIAAFRHLQSRRERLTFVSYEGLCAAGTEGVLSLCRRLGVDPEGRQDELAREFRPPTAHAALAGNAAPGLREEAEVIHAALLQPNPPAAARNLS